MCGWYRLDYSTFLTVRCLDCLNYFFLSTFSSTPLYVSFLFTFPIPFQFFFSLQSLFASFLVFFSPFPSFVFKFSHSFETAKQLVKVAITVFYIDQILTIHFSYSFLYNYPHFYAFMNPPFYLFSLLLPFFRILIPPLPPPTADQHCPHLLSDNLPSRGKYHNQRRSPIQHHQHIYITEKGPIGVYPMVTSADFLYLSFRRWLTESERLNENTTQHYKWPS